MSCGTGAALEGLTEQRVSPMSHEERCVSETIPLARSAGPWAGSSQPNAVSRRVQAEMQATIRQLAATDRHVRAHEQAHLAAAGPYAIGGPSYSYAMGPDGHRYAVGGEVSLDTSPDPSDPEATIEKAKVIQAAANAPVDPSTQDRMVAAQAAQMEAAAELQMFAQQQHVQPAYLQREKPVTGRLIDVEL